MKTVSLLGNRNEHGCSLIECWEGMEKVLVTRHSGRVSFLELFWSDGRKAQVFPGRFAVAIEEGKKR